ncbi:hypothetical protein N7449_004963 [Penicillium cf. viridicatum]|uniref:Uncharacterized protein n=1 Tax=Penicillium cf. viridicatum TaxID=2972119 RepID=A0A9W9MKE3_9EURO|nr:hypothetical protein N7449_004963 [Penicillium cf. viridicatum]
MAEMYLPDVVKMALFRPHRASTVFSRQQSMLDRMNSGTTPQTMAIALGAVVDADKWKMGRPYNS